MNKQSQEPGAGVADVDGGSCFDDRLRFGY
jgi:hypothetical protein